MGTADGTDASIHEEFVTGPRAAFVERPRDEALAGFLMHAQTDRPSVVTPNPPGVALWERPVREGGMLRVFDHVPRSGDDCLAIRYEGLAAQVASAHFLQFFWFQLRLHGDAGPYALGGAVPLWGYGAVALTTDPATAQWMVDSPSSLPWYDDAADYDRTETSVTMYDAPHSGNILMTVLRLLGERQNSPALHHVGMIRSVEFLMHLETYLLRVEPRRVAILTRLHWIASAAIVNWQGNPYAVSPPMYWVGEPPRPAERLSYSHWSALSPRFRDYAARIPWDAAAPAATPAVAPSRQLHAVPVP